MMIARPSSPEILDRFLAFARELERQRGVVERPTTKAKAQLEEDRMAVPAFLLDAPVAVIDRTDTATAGQADLAEADPEVILERLQSYLEADLRSFARDASDLALAQYREAQYAMVALADDMFLHEIEWAGAETWRLNHLEQRVFHSRLAGDRVFDRMDALLATGDRRLVQLASVYLCILSLGFRGRHRATGSHERVRDYAGRLYELIAGREPTLLGEWGAGRLPSIIPSAYAYTLQGETSRRARWHPRWGAGLVAVLVAWLVVGLLIWASGTASINELSNAAVRAAGEKR